MAASGQSMINNDAKNKKFPKFRKLLRNCALILWITGVWRQIRIKSSLYSVFLIITLLNIYSIVLPVKYVKSGLILAF